MNIAIYGETKLGAKTKKQLKQHEVRFISHTDEVLPQELVIFCHDTPELIAKERDEYITNIVAKNRGRIFDKRIILRCNVKQGVCARMSHQLQYNISYWPDVETGDSYLVGATPRGVQKDSAFYDMLFGAKKWRMHENVTLECLGMFNLVAVLTDKVLSRLFFEHFYAVRGNMVDLCSALESNEPKKSWNKALNNLELRTLLALETQFSKTHDVNGSLLKVLRALGEIDALK